MVAVLYLTIAKQALFLFLLLDLLLVLVQAQAQASAVTDSVILRRLDDGHVLVTLASSNLGSIAQHQSHFPPAIASLFDTYPIEDLRLSLTRGRWRSHWGIAPGGSSPTGAAVAVTWHPRVTPQLVPTLWTGVTNTVSGLFCASLGTLAHSTRYGALRVWQPPSSADGSALASLNATLAAPQQRSYGALSQEAVCTENLTAFLKLLPCRDRAGAAAALLQRAKVFGSRFHSFVINAASDATGGRVLLTLHMSYVVPTKDATSLAASLKQPSITFSVCPVASTRVVLSQQGLKAALFTDDDAWTCHRDEETLSICAVQESKREVTFDMNWDNGSSSSRHPASEASSAFGTGAVLTAAQHLLGSGDSSTTWLLQIDRAARVAAVGDSRASPEKLIVCSYSAFPWVLQEWLHTLAYTVNGVPVSWEEIGVWRSIQPGQTRKSRLSIEACYRLPPHARSMTVSMELSKSLLYLEEYPPDSHRGFDLEATRLIVLCDDSASSAAEDLSSSLCSRLIASDTRMPASDAVKAAGRLVHTEQEWFASLACATSLELSTNSVVVTVPTPDFSMPYIVCALTSSVLAVFAGLLLTALTYRRRVAAEWQQSKAGSRAAVLKYVVVGALFAVLVPYLDDEWHDWVVKQLQAAGLDIDRLF